LATVGDLSSGQNYGGFLWLVDATGAYRVRAIAIGEGSRLLNKRLLSTSFSGLTSNEGVRLLLSIIKDESSGDGDKGSLSKDTGVSINIGGWTLPEKTAVEIAIVDSSIRKMRRIRQALLI